MHIRAIGVDAAGHTSQAQEMQSEERGIEADKEEPEMPLSQCLVRHSTRHLGKPEIDAGEHRKQSAADEDIVEVRHNKIGVVHLQIYGNGRQHHPGKSSDQEDKKESEAPEHGDTN